MNLLISLNKYAGWIKIISTRFMSLVLAAVLALTCFTANAAVIELVDRNPSADREDYTFYSSSFEEDFFFDDYYAISFVGTRNLTASLFGSGANAAAFSAFDLLASDRTTIIIDGTVNSGPRAAFGTMEGFNLMGGDYFIRVAGGASGSGEYGGYVNLVSPVPEPETYAMMLAGLGMIGFVSRRKKQY